MAGGGTGGDADRVVNYREYVQIFNAEFDIYFLEACLSLR